jgi:hypothetical protein
MALLVFTVFVLLPPLARPAAGLSTRQRKVQEIAFGFVWLAIFVLAGMIVIAWWHVNFPPEFVVSGTIHNLTDPEMITTDEELYMRKRPVAGSDFEYQWRLIKPQRFTGNIELIFQKCPGNLKVLKYKLPIRKGFYKGTVEIEYDQTSNKMRLIHGTDKEEEIAPSAPLIPGVEPKASTHIQNLLTPAIVYADLLRRVKPEDVVRALDSDDPLIRAAARRDLIALGSSAIPYIGKALTDAASSYRLKVEALSTLKDMNQSAKQALSEPARCAIAKASNDPDPTLRSEAASVVAAGVTIPPTCGVALPITVAVPANKAWTNTHVEVQQGATISFRATGQINWGMGEDAVAGPGGSTTRLRPRVGRYRKYPVQTIGAGGLIGKIGKDGPKFAVGESLTMTATASGAVFLGINDNSYGDNSGEFQVTITMGPR